MLTQEQKSQIGNLLRVIIEQSNLFPDSDPLLLVKIPFSKLQSLDISFSEAKDLIKYVNRKVGTNDSYIDVLNGTLCKDKNVVGTMVTEVFEELEDVNTDDENDSLILWARNLDVIKNNVEKFFEIDVLKSKLKSRYENGKIIILQINEERKEIIRKDTRFKHSFRKVKGRNKRFEYLVKIYQNPKIGGTDLGSTTLQNISKEIKLINNTLKSKLKIPYKLIVNDDNSGYEISDKYHIEPI